MGMAANLLNDEESFKTNCQYPFDRRPQVKIAQVDSKKKTLHILYMYIAQGQGQITPREQNFDCN